MLDTLTRRMAGIFAGLRSKGRLSESDVAEMLREVRVALLEADVNFAVAKEFIARVKERAVGEDVYGSLTADQTIVRVVRDELTTMLGGETPQFNWSPAPPTVILMCGLQGSGKTTTCAKLAKWLGKHDKKAMLAACDIQRPAAIKQLEVLGEQVDVPVYSKLDGTKPVEIAKEALARCKHLMLDVLIVDTAGRLQVDEPLMEELSQIVAAVKPSEVFLVLDSTTGQEAVNVAKAFYERVEVTGAIFTKLDGDTRGGAVLSVKAATQVPVRFIGIGESTDALDMFHPDRMAQRILGMGDVLGIIEKAEGQSQLRGHALAARCHAPHGPDSERAQDDPRPERPYSGRSDEQHERQPGEPNRGNYPKHDAQGKGQSGYNQWFAPEAARVRFGHQRGRSERPDQTALQHAQANEADV